MSGDSAAKGAEREEPERVAGDARAAAELCLIRAITLNSTETDAALVCLLTLPLPLSPSLPSPPSLMQRVRLCARMLTTDARGEAPVDELDVTEREKRCTDNALPATASKGSHFLLLLAMLLLRLSEDQSLRFSLFIPRNPLADS